MSFCGMRPVAAVKHSGTKGGKKPRLETIQEEKVTPTPSKEFCLFSIFPSVPHHFLT